MAGITPLNKDFVTRAGLVVEGTNAVTSATNNTGSVQIYSGVAIAQNLIVGTTATFYGPVNITGAFNGYVSSAINLAGGVVGQIPIQNGTSSTTFISSGTNGQVLLFSAPGAAWADQTMLNVNSANVANNIAGGFPGKLLYQSNFTNTSFVDLGTPGQVLITNGVLGPLFVSTLTLDTLTLDYLNVNKLTAISTLTATDIFATSFTTSGTVTATQFIGNLLGSSTTSTNLANGAAGSIPMQLAPGVTTFIPLGAPGLALLAGVNTATWSPLSGVTAGAAYTATNLLAGTAGAVPYQRAFGLTSFVSGDSGQVLLSGGTSAPIFSSSITVASITATTISVTGNLYVNSTTYIAGDLFVDGTQFSVNKQTIYSGDLTITLSTASSNPLLAIGSGLQIGNTATPFISWLYDGVANWVSSNGIVVNSQVNAVSTSSGSLIVAGGAGFAKDVWINGNLIPATTASTLGTPTHPFGEIYVGPNSITVGSITVSSNANDLIVPGLFINSSTISTSTFTGALIVQGGAGFGGNLYTGGISNFINVATATNTTTGALQVIGGVGIGSNMYVGGQVNIISTNSSVSTATGALQITGGTGIGGNLYVGGLVNFINPSNTAFQVTGGANINGNLNVNNNLTVSGNSIVNALTATIFNAQSSNIIGDETVNGNLTVVTNFTVEGTILGIQSLTIDGYTQLTLLTATIFTATSANILGNETIGGTLTIGNTSTIAGSQIITTATLASLLPITTSTTSTFTIFNNTTATSTTTGALVVQGGVGIGGNLYVGKSGYIGGSQIVTTSTIGSLVITTTSTTGTFLIANITQSTSTNTGALIVDGGVGVWGNVNVGGAVTATNLFIGPYQVSTVTSLSFGGGTITGSTTMLSTASSTSTTTGALTVIGGVGIGQALNVGTIVSAGLNTTSTNITITAFAGNNFAQSSYTSNLTTASSSGIPVSLDTYNTATYKTAEYLIQITDTGANPPNIHVEKLIVFEDGTNVYITEYAVMTNNGELGTFNAQYTGSSVTLTFTPTNPVAMTIKLVKTAITV